MLVPIVLLCLFDIIILEQLFYIKITKKYCSRKVSKHHNTILCVCTY